MSPGQLFLLTAALLHGCHGLWYPRGIGTKPGPQVRATVGKVWPKVQQQQNFPGFLVLRTTAFNFKVTGVDCDLMRDAFKRYQSVFLGELWMRRQNMKTPPYKSWRKNRDFQGYLDTLEVNLLKPCEVLPYLGMDEAYELRVNSPERQGTAVLSSDSIWGILRGLETFSQLLVPDPDGVAMIINSTAIVDYPRFPHRGLLLDTSRHFLSVSSILEMLDAMEYNKMNVFHWHIVDDQSFPYESALFPMLSQKGAYSPHLVYTRDEILSIIEYARQRGIRVIPEFDTPGHTRSWGEGIPDVLTPCYDGDEPDGTFGPINPIQNITYDFLHLFFTEVVELFSDQYVHLGGDEVNFECWASNPAINKFMEAHNITGNYAQLEEIYIQRLIDITDELNASSVVWQEVFDNGVDLPGDTVVHVWTGDQSEELAKVTKAGHPALLSACWYLDHLSTGGDWQKFYLCDPQDFPGSEEQKMRVIGGEACMWGEVVDDSNLATRVWPRASAAAEKLWSQATVSDINDAAHRLEEHTCRMKRRGIEAQPPNGPGFCP
ncbi:beta-hexosaminidase subunit beta [Anabrus simplex]|uniref:beta-hexosaminidase subunit beta n=1 Tax=Anabrus simplex TaxID=316456 RepID=UPI0035A341A5